MLRCRGAVVSRVSLGVAIALVGCLAAATATAAPSSQHLQRQDRSLSASVADSEASIIEEDYEKAKSVITAASIPVGFAFVWFGAAGRYEKLSTGCVAAALGAAAAFLVGQVAAKGTSVEVWVAVGSGVFGAVLGVCLMLFSRRARLAGVVLLGVAAGAVAALWLQVALLHRISNADTPLVLFYICLGLFSVAAAVLSCRKGPGSALPCWTTSLIGSYAFVHGVGYFVGGLQDPITLQYSSGVPALDAHDALATWIYLAAVVVFWWCGAYVQLRQRAAYLKDKPELDALTTSHVTLYYGNSSAYGSA